MAWVLALLGCGDRCGDGGHCQVEGGEYLLLEPAEADGPVSVFLYFHGYSNSAEDMVDRSSVVAMRDAGWLVVLPEGKNSTWSNRGAPSQDRDEIVFVDAVLADVRERYQVTEVVSSGFSQGSSMAWDAACYLPGRIDGLMGASGSFWVPEPATCEQALPVRHTHGTEDRVMPLEGRPIGSASQGDVFVGIEAWRVTNGCAVEPDEVRVEGPETCTIWSSCTSGADVELCLFEGGHRTPSGWAGRMLDWWATDAFRSR